MSPQPSTRVANTIETLTADRPFEVEVTGPRTADIVVIMVHGFGVTRDSRGLFTDIEAAISNRYLSIRPELSIVGEDGTTALPFSIQAERLNRVSSYVESTFAPQKTIYIGHSQGNLVIAQAALDHSKMILLAPPAEFHRFIETDGWKKSASYLDLEGTSRLARSDLTIEVPLTFWSEFESTNAAALYSYLAEINEVKVVFPSDDAQLGSREVPVQIPCTSITNAGHDFVGASRKDLVKLILSELGSD